MQTSLILPPPNLFVFLDQMYLCLCILFFSLSEIKKRKNPKMQKKKEARDKKVPETVRYQNPEKHRATKDPQKLPTKDSDVACKPRATLLARSGIVEESRLLQSSDVPELLDGEDAAAMGVENRLGHGRVDQHPEDLVPGQLSQVAENAAA
jgi:hypothetical protein